MMLSTSKSPICGRSTGETFESNLEKQLFGLRKLRFQKQKIIWLRVYITLGSCNKWSASP